MSWIEARMYRAKISAGKSLPHWKLRRKWDIRANTARLSSAWLLGGDDLQLA
jgi:hypothetical protein